MVFFRFKGENKRRGENCTKCDYRWKTREKCVFRGAFKAPDTLVHLLSPCPWTNLLAPSKTFSHYLCWLCSNYLFLTPLNQQLTLIPKENKEARPYGKYPLKSPPSQFILHPHPHEFYLNSRCEQSENWPACPNMTALGAHKIQFYYRLLINIRQF